MRFSTRILTALPALSLLLVAGCTSPGDAPTEAHFMEEAEVQAQILAVNKSTREVTLEAPDGRTLVVLAGPEVRNFDQIEAGDTITAHYTLTADVRRMTEEEPDVEPAMGMEAARAVEGDKPGVGVAAGVTMTVVVKSVDLENNIVSFTGPDGALQALEAQRDEGKAFLKGLRAGDRVQITFAEAMILTVD